MKNNPLIFIWEALFYYNYMFDPEKAAIKLAKRNNCKRTESTEFHALRMETRIKHKSKAESRKYLHFMVLYKMAT